MSITQERKAELIARLQADGMVLLAEFLSLAV